MFLTSCWDVMRAPDVPQVEGGTNVGRAKGERATETRGQQLAAEIGSEVSGGRGTGKTHG